MTFNDIIYILSEDAHLAEFSPNEYTDKSDRIPYGYYDLKKTGLGPVMIEVGFVDEYEDGPSNMILIKIQNLKESFYSVSNQNKQRFRRGLRFINSLDIIPSKLSKNEAFARFSHVMSSEEEKQALNTHYLNARVTYDTMHEMMRAENIKIFDKKNNGLVIESTLDNGEVETIQIKRTQERNKFNKLYEVMHIAIPSIGLQDDFNNYVDITEKLLFKKAQKFIDIAKGQKNYNSDVDIPEDFVRWDWPYINLMAEIKKHRGKVK